MSLPVIGAALRTDFIETYRDWLLEKDRDVEIQSLHTAAVLDADSRRDTLAGRGRFGAIVRGPAGGM